MGDCLYRSLARFQSQVHRQAIAGPCRNDGQTLRPNIHAGQNLRHGTVAAHRNEPIVTASIRREARRLIWTRGVYDVGNAGGELLQKSPPQESVAHAPGVWIDDGGPANAHADAARFLRTQ